MTLCCVSFLWGRQGTPAILTLLHLEKVKLTSISSFPKTQKQSAQMQTNLCFPPCQLGLTLEIGVLIWFWFLTFCEFIIVMFDQADNNWEWVRYVKYRNVLSESNFNEIIICILNSFPHEWTFIWSSYYNF